MPTPNKSLWLAVLAGVSVFGLIAYMWTRVESQQRQTSSLRDQLERMTNRIDLLTEVVEAASARAVRAEENARTAAEARDKAQAERAEAEKKSVEARAEAQTSTEQAHAALALCAIIWSKPAWIPRSSQRAATANPARACPAQRRKPAPGIAEWKSESWTSRSISPAKRGDEMPIRKLPS